MRNLEVQMRNLMAQMRDLEVQMPDLPVHLWAASLQDEVVMKVEGGAGVVVWCEVGGGELLVLDRDELDERVHERDIQLLHVQQLERNVRLASVRTVRAEQGVVRSEECARVRGAEHTCRSRSRRPCQFRRGGQ